MAFTSRICSLHPRSWETDVEAPATSSLRTLLAAELMTARRLGSTRFGLDRRQALLALRRQDRQATLLWLVVE
jgi:hypothetical protein